MLMAIVHSVHTSACCTVAGATVLTCDAVETQCGVGASAALDFRCSGKVANVTVRAARAACVRHQQGSLWVSV